MRPLSFSSKLFLSLPWLLSFLVLFPLHARADSPLEEDGEIKLHAECVTLGASIGRVEGLTRSLDDLAGPDNGAIILEGTWSAYLTPYLSEEYQLNLFFVNDFNMAQFAYGIHYSTVPFPKAFIRPWVGAYATLNLLEDLRVREYDPDTGVNEADGIGLGVAAAVGVTVRLDESLALEGFIRGDEIFTAGWLDTGEFFNDRFGVRGVYIRLLYIFQD